MMTCHQALCVSHRKYYQAKAQNVALTVTMGDVQMKNRRFRDKVTQNLRQNVKHTLAGQI